MSINLATDKLQRIGRLAGMFSECRTESDIRNMALEGLEPVFACNASNFYMTSNQGGHWISDNVITRGLTGNMHEFFNRRFFRLDPFYNVPPHPGLALTEEALVDWREYWKSEYYNDFMRPQGIHHQMNIWLNCENGVYGVLALFRPKARKYFDDSDRILLELTAPLISGAITRLYNRNEIYRLKAVFRALTRECPYRGLLVLNEQLEIMELNRTAAEIIGCADNDPEEPRDYKAPPEIVRACLDIKAKLNTGLKSKKITLERQDTQKEIKAEVRFIDYIEGACLFLVVLGHYEIIHNWADGLRIKQISPREMDVIECLLEGLTNREIARRLFISENTVQNHLKSIFKKTDVRSRAVLIRQLVGPVV